MNKWIGTGKVIKDPTIRYKEDKASFVAFTMMCKRNRKIKDGDQAVDFIDCICTGNIAELARQYLRDGKKIEVMGPLQSGSYIDRETGKKIYTKTVFVGECELYRPSLLSCGYDVIEAVQTDAYDEGGEYAENYLDDVTKEQREELEEQLDVVFNAWLEKYDLYPNFYTIPTYETYKYIDGKFEREEE